MGPFIFSLAQNYRIRVYQDKIYYVKPSTSPAQTLIYVPAQAEHSREPDVSSQQSFCNPEVEPSSKFDLCPSRAKSSSEIQLPSEPEPSSAWISNLVSNLS